LELESSDQAIVNEFQETITTLTNNIESQLQKNARLETEVKTLRTQINELNSKFAQMTQDVMNLTNRIQNNENLQSEINLLKEEINKLK
jgi:predicted RNase H-like nuclease (RuvC/YqgF family)